MFKNNSTLIKKMNKNYFLNTISAKKTKIFGHYRNGKYLKCIKLCKYLKQKNKFFEKEIDLNEQKILLDFNQTIYIYCGLSFKDIGILDKSFKNFRKLYFKCIKNKFSG
jgi:hypothetical protein